MAEATGSNAVQPLSPTPTQLASWGLEPAWSRRVVIDGADGSPVDWHVLDTGPGEAGTIVCVHGNPTWGYLWRDLLRELSPQWRVIAVDQTGMGYSERGRPRRLAERIEELVNFVTQEVDGPFVMAAHDWGGPVAVGASASLNVEALILANTAVAKPTDVAVPPLIAAARSLVDLSCRRTPTFVTGTAHMTDKVHRDALQDPYRDAARREAVRDFVADIPVIDSDPSFSALEECARTLDAFDKPALMIWGGRDPVFHDRFLRDLRQRIPQAQIERFADAAHLVLLDKPSGAVVRRWLDQLRSGAWNETSAPTPEVPEFRSILSSIESKAADQTLVYSGPDGTLSWAQLNEQSSIAAGVLEARGLRTGDRVSVLIPPSPELLVAASAIWKAGGVPVVADASAGLGNLRRLIRASSVRFVIGTRSTLAVAKTLRFAPGATFAAFFGIPGVADLTKSRPAPERQNASLNANDIAAIVHTSGATGPAKAVRYTHGALAAQREIIGPLFSMKTGDAFTTSFGPFMLLAPSLEMTCVRPAFKVDDPGALDFETLVSAIDSRPVTTAWLSPASARAIIETAEGRHVPLDLVMLAGAPIHADMVEAISEITGGDVRTPYGMTECLPVTDGTQPTREGPLGGFSTGSPIPGCTVRIQSLTPATEGNPEWGEILVNSPWMFDGYDASWLADDESWVHLDGIRFHRTGDVGYLSDGLLFHLGRRGHVIDAALGPIASVSIESPISEFIGRQVAAVGIGPQGAQVLCVVVESGGDLRLADQLTRERVRSASPQRIASVLEGPLPVDRRHRSKIDRSGLRSSVAEFLAGR